MTEHANIYTALAAAQAEMEGAKKSAINPAFKSKYADLSEVVDAVKGALSRHGIAFFSHLHESEISGRHWRTTLAHASGMIHCDVPLILGRNDMQGLGSAITYARRYGLMALAGIAPEDDDGNAAAANKPAQTDHGAAIKDAWKQAVLDSIPQDATLAQKAQAFADAIVADFQGKKSVKALENAWSRHGAIIDALKPHAKLWDIVADAFEVRKNELTPSESEGIPA